MALIFDLGRVIVSWGPVGIVSRVRGPQGAAELAATLFEHPDWLEVDRGTLSLHTMARRAEARTGLTAADILAVLEAVPPSLVPDPQMVELLAELHARGEALYALSNMGHASIDYLERHCAFWQYFRGKVVSARVRMMKPEAEIYRYLLVAQDLKAADCTFIDDSPANVAAAEQVGIRGIVFTSHDQCRRDLAALGLL